MLDFLTLTPKGSFANVEIQALLEENYLDAVEVTEHPVELGAAITDHAYRRPSEVILRCGWSNSSNLAALLGTASAVISGGSMAGADYAAAVYSQLLALQQARIPFSIQTTKRLYDSMLITALQVTTDSKTGNILLVTATCREIIVVETVATTLPPRANQADPASTAETENQGVVQPTPATPPTGGSVPTGAM